MPQSVNTIQDLAKQPVINEDLCHLKHYISGMAYDFGSDFDQLYLMCSQ